MTTPRWKKSSPVRERRRFRHFAVALPDFVRRGKHPAKIIPASGDSADRIPRMTTAQHAAARVRMGGRVARMGFRSIA